MSKKPIQPSQPTPLALPPDATVVTDADRSLAGIYLRLLDADTAGIDWKTAAQQILNLDPAVNCEHARQVFDLFLARARWMTEIGYQQLLKPLA